ncbi:hypothetical protein Pan14r_00430 [Crateriforma conspicua]|uniref:Uncharacterized protein n=1 Tax=Crateriforma conspicua TaxID=2527996 RepID=A0A5C5XWQ5_9PLAN|nr:hypothetical protein Pan14r_00430 [Crateriforma conspicua]
MEEQEEGNVGTCGPLYCTHCRSPHGHQRHDECTTTGTLRYGVNVDPRVIFRCNRYIRSFRFQPRDNGWRGMPDDKNP